MSRLAAVVPTVILENIKNAAATSKLFKIENLCSTSQVQHFKCLCLNSGSVIFDDNISYNGFRL